MFTLKRAWILSKILSLTPLLLVTEPGRDGILTTINVNRVPPIASYHNPFLTPRAGIFLSSSRDDELQVVLRPQIKLTLMARFEDHYLEDVPEFFEAWFSLHVILLALLFLEHHEPHQVLLEPR